MEVFSGDRGLPNDVVLFPDTHSTPFSLHTDETGPDHQKTATDNHHHRFLPPPPPPPQKLRPIRCNGRSLPECFPSDDPLVTKPLSWPAVAELGFYNAETDGGCFIPPDTNALGLQSNECQIETVLSSSSGDSSRLQEAIKEPVNKKKRKRKSRKKLELFIESMMRTIMEKQEEMHRQLIETLEKKEKDRIAREEAWKQREMERLKRDEQARAKEISRSLALISFIQNSLGHEIQISKPLNTSNQDKEGENQNEENSKSGMVNEETGNENQNEGNLSSGNFEESECESNTRRWPKSEVQALITVRAALNQKFYGKGPKGSVWEEVAAGLSILGFNRSAKKCREKWENINKYYRRTMEKGKENAGKSQVCTYFNELEMLYKNGIISGNTHDEDQNMNAHMAH